MKPFFTLFQKTGLKILGISLIFYFTCGSSYCLAFDWSADCNGSDYYMKGRGQDDPEPLKRRAGAAEPQVFRLHQGRCRRQG